MIRKEERRTTFRLRAADGPTDRRRQQRSRSAEEEKPLVGVIMGSKSDRPHLAPACELLGQLRVPYEERIVSAHRTPDWMFEYAGTAESRGLLVIIAGAGGAAHLPGMGAARRCSRSRSPRR